MFGFLRAVVRTPNNLGRFSTNDSPQTMHQPGRVFRCHLVIHIFWISLDSKKTRNQLCAQPADSRDQPVVRGFELPTSSHRRDVEFECPSNAFECEHIAPVCAFFPRRCSLFLRAGVRFFSAPVCADIDLDCCHQSTSRS